jgi:hypothetical protein
MDLFECNVISLDIGLRSLTLIVWCLEFAWALQYSYINISTIAIGGLSEIAHRELGGVWDGSAYRFIMRILEYLGCGIALYLTGNCI